MKHKIFLTSFIAIGVGCCVMSARAESFPSNGYMLENKTYENAATYKNMGVYDGTVTATAEYENTLYQIAAGTYLPAGAEGAAQCPANSYCPGITDATYNESADQGATSCPAGYPNSAAGASSNTQCYTACTVNSANIAHATAVEGNDYYGTGTDTCSATACENGYHVNDTAEVVEKTALIDMDYTNPGQRFAGIGNDGTIRGSTDTYGLTDNGTWAAEFEGDGVVYGQASCQPAPHDPGLEWVLENESDLANGNISPEQVREELTPIAGAAKANYLAKVVADIIEGLEFGPGAIDDVKVPVFGINKNASYSVTDSGAWCYCQMVGFQPNGGTRVTVDSAPWVRYHLQSPYDSSGDCASSCSYSCAQSTAWEMTDSRWDMLFRGAVFGALDFVAGGTCDANEITINWTDATDEDIAENNAGMCTYGGEIRTPVEAVVKPGKTFVGWKFSK